VAIGVGLTGPRGGSGGGGGTCTSLAWVRPSAWPSMPQTADGDKVTYLLFLVREDCPNYFCVNATTSSGNYTVDLYNDATAVTNHASGVTAEFDLSYSKGDQDYLDGKLVMIKITGEITAIDFNRRHSDASTLYDSGICSIKITSQQITTLVSLCRAQNITFYNMQEFEFFGTCNVTVASYMFYGSTALGYVSADLSSLTTNSLMIFYSTGQFDESNVTMPTSGLSCQYIYNYSARDFYYDVDGVKGITYPYRGFATSQLKECGTRDNPIKFDSATNLAQLFSNCYYLREAHLTNTGSVTSISTMFSSSYALRTITGLDASSITTTTNAFLNCRSLSKLEMTGMAQSFTIANCLFNREGIVEVFNGLADLNPAGSGTITITGNPGVADLTPTDEAIATDKRWTIVKT
jgi:hypothetical protein